MKRFLSLLFLLVLIAGTAYTLARSKYRTAEGRIFGTSYHIKYAGTQDLDNEILAELKRVDSSLSIFKPQSTVSRFNNNQSYANDEMLLEVVRLAQTVAHDTHGAFDITVAPLVNAWGFGFKNRDNVTPHLIDSLRTFVGYDKLHVEGGKITKSHPQLSVDLGAVAKGYGVDRVARLLSAKGCKHYMVEIGGEVVVKGENPEGKRWSLGVNRPVDDSTHTTNDIQTILYLTDRGVATSGNYRNFYYKGGRKYAHTIDPHTGYPVEHSLLSATVIATSCALADALATSCMVMGLEKAKALAQSRKDVDIYLIYAAPDGSLRTWQSAGMARFTKQ